MNTLRLRRRSSLSWVGMLILQCAGVSAVGTVQAPAANSTSRDQTGRLMCPAQRQAGPAQPGAGPTSALVAGALRRASGVLYCPAQPDDSIFRAALSEALMGVGVDYFDPRTETPTLELLDDYACVFTWVNYSYADNVAMGNVLADFVDAGGRVILGQWCLPTAGNFLAGRIMDDYCPATADDHDSDSYAGDGLLCPTLGIESFSSSYFDQTTTHDWAFSAGTTAHGYDFISMDADWRVWYSPGNTGGDYTTGDVVELTANLCTCLPGPIYGACCHPVTGECTDNVDVMDCLLLDFYFEQQCADLVLECGNLGACCTDDVGDCTWVCTDYVQESACGARFQAGVLCADMSPACGEWFPCTHTIEMWDDWGDGWNGGFIDVYVNGNLAAGGVTLSGGPGPGYAYFPADTGDVITTVWTPGGWPYESSYYILGEWECEICSDGVGGADPTGVTCFGSCLLCCRCGDCYCDGFGLEDCITCPKDCGPCRCIVQSPDEETGVFSDVDCDACDDSIQTVAENFSLLDEQTIHGVKVWGGYYPDNVPLDVDCFTVIFRQDEDELPGAAIAAWDCVAGTRVDTGVDVLGVDVYEYFVAVDELDLAPGNYWVEIRNDSTGSPESWFWESGNFDVFYGYAVWGHVFASTLTGESWVRDFGTDMALELICTDVFPGDLNCDGLADFFDIDPFVLAITDPAGYEAAYPDCDITLADCSGDGLVDFFDIDAFVLLITGG